MTSNRFWFTDPRHAACGPLLVMLVGIAASAHGDTTSPRSAERSDVTRERIAHEGIAGTLVLFGGGQLPDEGKAAFAAAVPPEQPVVIVAAASDSLAASTASATRWLGEQGIAAGRVHSASDDAAALAEQIGSAGAVWIGGGRQSRLADAYADTAVQQQLKALLEHGGVIGGTSAGAAIMSGVMIAAGSDRPRIATGWDLIPGAIIDQHFSERNRIGRLRLAVAEHPERFGLGIDEATAVVIHGRTVEVVGEGHATVVLAESLSRQAVEQPIPGGAVADLIQLQRAARWRCADADPGEPRCGPPEVANGSLVIVGGGPMPPSVVDRFIELAGGPQAHLVVLPTAVPRHEAMRAKVPRFLARANVASVTMLPQSRTEEIASKAFRQALDRATGIWFDGGRQWNFVDAYDNTDAIELFHAVLRRGGVIGGSSAGATIQGEYLVRGHPLGNTVMMAEGYERGFGFLPGVAIDQHFSQRRRHADLVSVIRRHPRLLGIGIDEATALVVTGSKAEVLGDYSAHFLRHCDEARGPESEPSDRPREPVAQDDYLSVPAGKTIDLKTLKLCEP